MSLKTAISIQHLNHSYGQEDLRKQILFEVSLEPTAALDQQSGRDIVELMHYLAKEQSCTILLVTHDTRILDIADRVVHLEDGRLTDTVLTSV